MSMRAQLKKYFASAAAHHTQMAKFAESAMNGCDEESDEHTMHKSAMESHISHAQCCAECAGAMGKADTGELEKLMPPPEGFSVVHDAAPNVRMVPRFGSPPLPPPDKGEVYREVFGIADAQE